jgi:hypothetical protein
MSFAPLAHSERVSVLLSIMKGGRIAIFSHVRFFSPHACTRTHARNRDTRHTEARNRDTQHTHTRHTRHAR